jgi:hypothetical protein
MPFRRGRFLDIRHMTLEARRASTRPRAEWSTDRGTTTIIEYSTTVVLVSAQGHLDSESGKRIAVVVLELLGVRPRHVFFDVGDLASYHPDVRRDVTELLLDQRESVLSLHVLARSKLVRMGVSVARLALPALVAYSEASAFNRALDAALREA